MPMARRSLEVSTLSTTGPSLRAGSAAPLSNTQHRPRIVSPEQERFRRTGNQTSACVCVCLLRWSYGYYLLLIVPTLPFLISGALTSLAWIWSKKVKTRDFHGCAHELAPARTRACTRTHTSLHTHALVYMHAHAHSLNSTHSLQLNSLTHSFTHSLIHSLTHSLTHSQSHARTHAHTHSAFGRTGSTCR